MRLQELKFDSWNELETFVKKKSSDLAQKSGERKNCVEFLKKVYAKGVEAQKNGDQEEAYKLLMVYCETLAYIGKKMKDTKFMTSMYASSFKEVLDDVQLLKKNLQSRYEEKENKKLEKKQEPVNVIPQKETDVTLPKNTPATQLISERRMKSNLPSISCEELRALMKESLLLVDVRPLKEFQESHITYDNIVNIPPAILHQAKTANQIEGKLLGTEKLMWSKRHEFKYIVFLDEYSEFANLNPSLPLYLALNSINKWDPNTKYKNEAVILEGGYENWLNHYPTISTNPNIQPFRNEYPLPSLDDIQYPTNDLFDTPKRAVSIPKVTPVIPKVAPVIPKVTPVIPDRNSKPLLNNSKGDQNAVSDKNKESKVSVNAASDVVNQDDKVDEVIPKHKQPTINGIDESLMSDMSNIKINGDSEPTKPEKKVNGNVAQPFTIHNLKPDGPSETMSSNSGMKRSVSSPNINQLKEDGAGAAPIPTIDRSSKPQPQKYVENYDIRDLRDSDPVHGKVTPGLTGLKNLRNTCYMNSILQCLSNTQDLNKFFRNSKDFQKNGKSKTEGAIAEEFRTVIYKLWAGEFKSFACKSLKNRIGQYRNTFSGYDQQDSHEFLTILIDWLHEDLKRPAHITHLAGASEESGERAWGEFTKNNHSPIQELFYGQQRSVVTCTKCPERSITFEPFSNLSLPLPSSKDSCTLNDCLALYVQKETIQGWECPKCKSCRTAEKKLDITRLPPILVIHFKRFTSDGWCRKQQTYVDFPVKETLDMSNFLFGSEHRNVRFSLYAVSNHYGTMDSGHYTAYCKGEKLKRWYKFDDQEVCEISTDAVKTAAAYIVFYSRINMENT